MTANAASARPLVVISVLGVVQIVNWGSTYYLPAVLGKTIAADTGWSYGWIIAGLSAALLVAGVSAMRIGRIIEASGGRQMLAAAAVLIAAGQVGLAVAPNIALYMAAWMVLGLGMAAGLYDASFSTLGRLYGQSARQAISTLTLWGGFASTVCWPLSALLVEQFGWRGACLTYAFIQVAICLPLIWWFIPNPPAAEARPTQTHAGGPVGDDSPAPNRTLMFAILAGILTLGSSVSALVSVHLITLLQADGLSYAAAVGLGTLIGPSQVGSRIMERLAGARLHPMWTIAGAVTLIAGGVWLQPVLATIAIVSYGAGNGIWSIARGTLPLALFGAKGYAAVMGKLAAPSLILQSLAPSIGAVMIDRLGANATMVTISVATLINVAGVALLWLAARPSMAAWTTPNA